MFVVFAECYEVLGVVSLFSWGFGFWLDLAWGVCVWVERGRGLRGSHSATQRAQLRMDATYPIEMPSLGFETLSVLRWHSWTVGAHGPLGRKGGYGPYGAAWADSTPVNPLYGNGEPEIIFLGGSNGIPYVRFKIECF